jgi:hypothetical protein
MKISWLQYQGRRRGGPGMLSFNELAESSIVKVLLQAMNQ